jgi:hypothetical protein
MGFQHFVKLAASLIISEQIHLVVCRYALMDNGQINQIKLVQCVENVTVHVQLALALLLLNVTLVLPVTIYPLQRVPPALLVVRHVLIVG